jgi:predicted DNA binding protein
MIEAVLIMKMPKSCAMRHVSMAEARVKVVQARPYQEEGVASLMEIKAEEECLKNLMETISEDPGVYRSDFSATGGGRTKAAVAVKRCVPARDIVESECFISAARMEGEDIVWHLIATREALKRLSERLQSHGFDFKLKKIGKLTEEETLTEKEDEILRYAIEKGYFETPKRVGVREIAKHFGISISTLSEILRRGQKKVILSFFKGKD